MRWQWEASATQIFHSSSTVQRPHNKIWLHMVSISSMLILPAPETTNLKMRQPTTKFYATPLGNSVMTTEQVDIKRCDWSHKWKWNKLGHLLSSVHNNLEQTFQLDHSQWWDIFICWTTWSLNLASWYEINSIWS